MQTKLFFVMLISFTLLISSVSQAGESKKISETVANTKTDFLHIKLAEYYEKEAKELSEKVEEQKNMLQEYENHSEYYGRSGQDFHSHHEALLREYTKAAERNAEMAAAHRKMAK
ncbi:hypothetical protein [Nitrosomonas supralitoralis]|uniref:DUF4398 domain-containing protein n=1 Tax=Nitrosomonas supralitoralis TaxID=2116706 RepID=A0A2P7NTJ0_9PROT|nr:hypothetical protein [Nitrosomonas supralitoralis]PSJ16749.1 hypothetical protein C7H79_11735 [Nitrosomonas supralitoralis]